MPPKKDDASNVSSGVDKWGEALRIHQEHGLILVQGSSAMKLPSAVADAVEKVMGASSFKEMRSKSANKIIDRFANNGASNEISVLLDFWLGLNRGKYQKEVEGNTLEHDWDDQGLAAKFDQQFCFRGPSMLEIDKPEDDKLLKSIKGIQHPKPDISLGLCEKLGDKHFFNPDEISANMMLNEHAQITWDLFHPFVIWEYKVGKPIELAQVQALRGGSTLVWSNREMKAKAGMLDLKAPRIDTSNIAFSFCGHTSMVRLFVHYAIVEGDGTSKYYMQLLSQYFTNDISMLKKLRSDLEHILDWGTLTRLNGPDGVKAMLKKIKPPKEEASHKVAKTTHGTSAAEESRAEGNDD